MRKLHRRYGHAKKPTEAEQRARLHELLKQHAAVLDGVGGPLSKFQAHELAKLAYTFKYDREFEDSMLVRHAGKPGPAPKHEDMPVMTNKVRRPGYAD